MHGHEHFEELAGLAAVGELSADEWQEFVGHRRNCAHCSAVNANFAGVAALAFDAGATSSESSAERKERSRAAVLRNLHIVRANDRRRAHSFKPVMTRAAVALVLFASGLMLGRSSQSAPASTATKAQITAGSGAGSVVNKSVEIPNSPTAQEKLVARLQQDVARLSSARKHLEEQLAVATEREKSQAIAAAGANERVRDQARELASTTADLQAAHARLQQAQTEATANVAGVVELRYKLAEAEARLKETAATLNRERQLLNADREIRDIMGARDVHIVDVFDIDGKGRAKKPFGRAFYTQGRSLIFYAFDLPAPKSDKGEYGYYAWGRNTTAGHGPTRRLGIFFNDDQAQQRWMMKFDDPKVLAEIDTVFVTLEPLGLEPAGPTGKPILDAYFGTPPNHP